MKKAITLIALLAFVCTSITLFAQTCPQTVTKSSNNSCFQLMWNSPPSPLPNSFSSMFGTYIYSSGPGTTSNAAIYLRAGGNGRCNGNQSAFTGNISFPGGPTCIFLDGESTAPLPVTLVEFKLRGMENEVAIEWSTSSELYNRAFIVQRSTDGYDWQDIAEVPGKGTTQEFHSYSIVDRSPVKGLNFYRLVQEDLDGAKTTYSVKTIRVAVSQGEILVFPNPARSLISISSPDDGTFGILTTTGKTVREGVFQSGQSLDVSSLSPGFYLIRVQANGNESTQRLVIRE